MKTEPEKTPVKRTCSAVSSRTGKPCKKSPIAGGTVCTVHGGRAPQVKAKAAKRVKEEQLRRRMRDYWTAREGVSPAEAYAEALAVSTGNLDAIVHLLGDSEPQPDAIQLAQTIATDHARLAKMGLDAGVAERIATLEEAKVIAAIGPIVTALRAALTETGIEPGTIDQVMKLVGIKLREITP